MSAALDCPLVSEIKRRRKRLYKHALVFSTKLDEAIKTHQRLQEEIFKQPYKDWRHDETTR
jgi:hypothetical protein